jgi:hypothetical protein
MRHKEIQAIHYFHFIYRYCQGISLYLVEEERNMITPFLTTKPFHDFSFPYFVKQVIYEASRIKINSAKLGITSEIGPCFTVPLQYSVSYPSSTY